MNSNRSNGASSGAKRRNSASVSMKYSESGNKAVQIRPITAPCPNTGLIKVRYGANKIAIFNSKCQRTALVECIRKKCGFTSIEDELDLMSWKGGELQNISENGQEYADESLKERETYLLVKVIEGEDEIDGSRLQVISLLDNLEKVNPSLAVKLHDITNPEAKFIRAKWTALSKKGLEVDGSFIPSDSSQKGLNTILNENNKNLAAGGNKFVGLIAAAMKQKKDQEITEDKTNMASPRKSAGKKKVKI